MGIKIYQSQTTQEGPKEPYLTLDYDEDGGPTIYVVDSEGKNRVRLARIDDTGLCTLPVLGELRDKGYYTTWVAWNVCGEIKCR